MTENLKKFVEEASKNEELREKLMKLKEGEESQAILIAREYGFELTEEDLKPEDDEKLSLDEIDTAAGGGVCGCAIGGGGTPGGNDGTCACPVIGFGSVAWDSNKPRCACPAIGGGKSWND